MNGSDLWHRRFGPGRWEMTHTAMYTIMLVKFGKAQTQVFQRSCRQCTIGKNELENENTPGLIERVMKLRHRGNFCPFIISSIKRYAIIAVASDHFGH